MEQKDVYYELVMAQSIGEETFKDVQKKILDRQASIQSKISERSALSKFGRQMSHPFGRQDSEKSGGIETKTKKKGKDEEEEEAPTPTPVLRVVRMNAPEWPFLVLGAIGAASAGVVMPVFSIIFAKLLRVSCITSLV
jgi:hypothetical protein